MGPAGGGALTASSQHVASASGTEVGTAEGRGGTTSSTRLLVPTRGSCFSEWLSLYFTERVHCTSLYLLQTMGPEPGRGSQAPLSTRRSAATPPQTTCPHHGEWLRPGPGSVAAGLALQGRPQKWL